MPAPLIKGNIGEIRRNIGTIRREIGDIRGDMRKVIRNI